MSPSQEHSSVQTTPFVLQEHFPVHLFPASGLFLPQLRRTNWQMESGAGSFSENTGFSCPLTDSHPSFRGTSRCGFKTKSWCQIFASKCARLMCSLHAQAVGGSFSTHWSGFSWRKMLHRKSFAFVSKVLPFVLVQKWLQRHFLQPLYIVSAWRWPRWHWDWLQKIPWSKFSSPCLGYARLYLSLSKHASWWSLCLRWFKLIIIGLRMILWCLSPIPHSIATWGPSSGARRKARNKTCVLWVDVY